MYLARIRRSCDDSDVRLPVDKKERFDRSMSVEVPQTQRLSYYFHSEKIAESPPPEETDGGGKEGGKFDPDELPDGFCISPQRSVQGQDTAESAVRPAEYIGSFSVVGEDQKSRAEYVRKQLSEMREVTKTKQVLLVISLSGIKVCSSNGESVYMAHALKRISYATCDPEYCQFSFLAREPKGQTNIQYCHAFITKTPEEAEELNNIVGNAFQMAYAYQRQLQQQEAQKPSFNDMIQKQIEDQKAQFDEYNQQKQKQLQQKLQQISTATIAERVKERRERRKEHERVEQEEKMTRLGGKERMSWAKQIVGRTRHKLPYSDDPHWQQAISNTSAGTSKNSEAFLSQRSSIVSIKEAFDTSEFHGSPVMALKETIDNHFNGTSPPVSHGTSHVTSADVHTTPDVPDGGENYLYPVMSSPSTNQNSDNKGSPKDSPSLDNRNGVCDPSTSDPHRSSPPAEKSSPHADMNNRPLPLTPTEEKRSRRKSKTREGRKSALLGDKSDESTSSPSPSRSSPQNSSLQLSNGNGRPVSVAYQNDSPVHYPGSSQDNGDVYAGPPTPKRYDSLRKLDPSTMHEDDVQLKQAPWYQAGIPREIALDMLSQQEIGSFVVRDSTTHPGCYALSVKVPKFENPTGISHYLIHRSSRGGLKLKGLDKEWPTMTALVTHHTVMPEMLPCTLRLPRNSNNPAFKDKEDKEDREEDEDYQKLADFSNMMAHLKM